MPLLFENLLLFLFIGSIFIPVTYRNFLSTFDFYWYYPLYAFVLGYALVKGCLKALLKYRYTYFVLFVFVSSSISILYAPYPWINYLKQLAGFIFSGYAWLSLFILIPNVKQRIFVYYKYFAIIAAALTIPEQILHISGTHLTPMKGGWLGMYRCYSFCSEPFFLAMLLIPVLVNYLKSGSIRNSADKLVVFLLFTGIFFTFSFGGWIGLLVCLSILLLSNRNKKSVLYFFLLLITVVSIGTYKGTRLRITETINLFSHFPKINDYELLKNTNTSSRAIYLNFVAAYKQITINPFTGGGLGSHQIAYRKNIIKELQSEGIYIAHYNEADGGSGFTRWLSELGLTGLLFLLILFYYLIKNQNNKLHLPALGYWISFFVHSGNYFSHGTFFWLFMLDNSFFENNRRNEEGKP